MDNRSNSPTSLARRWLGFVRSTDPRLSASSVVVVLAILCLWLAVVIFTETKHEFWRDEVRSLSIARAAGSPLDLVGLTQYEGHPLLWYLLLYVGKSIVDTSLVLPVISIIISFAAVAVFMFFSPFELWIKILFIFCALPLYEYSVVARNYGISMLLLFIAALFYRDRTKHALLLAFILFLLANTNFHSAMLVCLISIVWAWDTFIDQRIRSTKLQAFSYLLPFAIVLIGVLLCVVSVMPKENTILTSVRQGVRMHELLDALSDATFRPDKAFSQQIPSVLPPWIAIPILFLAAFGLLHRPTLFLAALAGQIGFGVLFLLVYDGFYRHQGLFIVFLLFLYWLLIDSSKVESMSRLNRLLFNIGLYVALVTLILWNVVQLKDTLWQDIVLERSSSKAFGEFLNNSAAYRDAIIVPEPDYFQESLPYYAQNKIYFPREHHFGTTVSFTTEANPRLSLGKLLSIARDIKTRYGKPVLIVLANWDVDQKPAGKISYSYNKVFSWDSAAQKDFLASTQFVIAFSSAYSDENYRVYALR
jgi:hypothetical protein